MSDIINVDIQEENPIEIIEIYVDENAAQSAADSAALAQQLIAGMDQRNTIIVDSSFTKVGQVFTGLAASQWNIDGLVYTNPANVVHTIPLAASGKRRWERVVLNTSNTFQRVPGTEVTENPAMPGVPDNTLEYTFYLVTDTEVGNANSPNVGSNYQAKAEKGDALYSLGSFEYISATEASYARILNQTTGFLKAISVAIGNTHAYQGKEYDVKNETGAVLTIKNQDTTLVGSNYKKFWFSNGLDFVLQPGESALFHYSNGRFELKGMSKSWMTHQKVITGNTTLDNTFNGAIVKVKATAIITVPNVLPTDFSCVFRTFTGATGTFVGGAGVTMDAQKGLILEPFKMATLFKDGSSSTFVLEGELKV